MQALINLVSGLFMPVEAPSKHPPRLSMSNRKLRKSGKVKLVDVPWPFDEEDRQWIADETLKVLNEAAQVANRVYLITQPVAYDADQHPGVPDKWVSLYPVKGEENSYYSNKSVADSIRTRNAIMEQVARWHGTPVIDLDGYMRPLLRDRDDLFDDKWHFAPAGAEAAAEYVAMQLGIINPPWIYRGNESSRAD